MSAQIMPFYWKAAPLEAKLSGAIKRTISDIRRKWKFTSVLTDDVYLKKVCHISGTGLSFAAQGKMLIETELRRNELSATTFQVGCYIVRSSLCVYERDVLSHSGLLHKHIHSVAKASDVDYVKQELLTKKLALTDPNEFWMKNLYIFHEISAKHSSRSADAPFKTICRAECGSSESVETICTAKANRFVDDENAVLFIQYARGGKQVWIRFDGLSIYNEPPADIFQD